jgi:hypothetical protein
VYELRFGARESRLRRSGWSVELLTRKRGDDEVRCGYTSRGPGRPSAELDLSLTGQCDDPRESFVIGWAPPDVTSLTLLTRDGSRIAPRLLELDGHETPLVFAPVDGVPRVTALEIARRDGSTTRGEIERSDDPCRGLREGAFFVAWYGATRA